MAMNINLMRLSLRYNLYLLYHSSIILLSFLLILFRNAAHLLDTNHPAAGVHCAMAKKTATDLGFNVVNDALQLHGGYGYLKVNNS